MNSKNKLLLQEIQWVLRGYMTKAWILNRYKDNKKAIDYINSIDFPPNS